MVALVIALGLLITAVAIIGVLAAIAVTPPKVAGRWRPPTADDRARMRARSLLLFARHDDRSITLDCTVVEVEKGAADGAPPGSPFTLAVRPPDNDWFSARVEQLLEQWAAEARLVDVEIVEGRSTLQAGITCGTSRVMLELQGTAGLESVLQS